MLMVDTGQGPDPCPLDEPGLCRASALSRAFNLWPFLPFLLPFFFFIFIFFFSIQLLAKFFLSSVKKCLTHKKPCQPLVVYSRPFSLSLFPFFSFVLLSLSFARVQGPLPSAFSLYYRAPLGPNKPVSQFFVLNLFTFFFLQIFYFTFFSPSSSSSSSSLFYFTFLY